MDASGLIVLALVIQAVRISVPYAFAALGGTFSERGGVINIGLEGILLTSAFVCVIANWYTFQYIHDPAVTAWLAPWLGVLAALICGLILGLVLALTTVTFKADQIICGLAINIFAMGFTKFTNDLIFHSPSNSERVLPMLQWHISETGPLSLLNPLLHPLVLLALVIIVCSHIVLFKTPFGLHLRAVGEHPEAADTLGISVTRYRYYGVLIGGAIAGLGGAWLAIDQCRFAAGMSAGRGYIALAAMIVGKWKPWGAVGACLLFGFAEALQIKLQATGFTLLPNQIVQMLPYVLTILVLAGFIGRAIPPAADGIPYEKEAD